MTAESKEDDRTTYKKIEKFLGNPVLYIILFFVGSLILVVFPDRDTQLKMYFLVGLALLIGIGSYLAYQEWVSRTFYKSKYEKASEEKKGLATELTNMRKELARHPKIVTYSRAIKKSEILNMKGDADVSYDFTCNNGPNPLSKIEHVIQYDADPLKPSDVLIKTRGSPIPAEIKTLARCNFDGAVHTLVQYETTLAISFKPPVKPNEPFTYSYGFKYKKVYSKLREKEYTAHRVMHETDLLEIHIVAPKGSKFANTWDIEIFDFNNVKDETEEKRLNTESPPGLIASDREILWEIPLPKMTYTYRLYFKVL